jgi:hypothetical protein
VSINLHPHDVAGLVKEHTFHDGTTWRSCTAIIDGKRCRFATGEGRDPKIICHTHTSGDLANVLPELDDIVAPEYRDDNPEPEPVVELSADGWIESGEIATQQEVFVPQEGDEYIEDQDQDAATEDRDDADESECGED